ncbi:MAG: PilZ domain-containing protein [Pseudomonadota bacterium]
MTKTEQKRKYDRIGSLHLLNYVCLDENNEEVNQGMGRTLNVSQGGILLETHVPLDKKHVISLSIGLEEELVDIHGTVIYCREGKKGKTESGIEFQNIDETSLQVLNRYIKAFREMQKQEKK